MGDINQKNTFGDNIVNQTLNLAPQPGITRERMRENDREEDGYVTEERLTLEAGYAASKLRVDAAANVPLRLELGGGPTPQDVTMLMGSWEYDEAPTHKAIEVAGPFQGAYRAIVRTDQPAKVEVAGRFIE
jgi:hypothetical protein